MNHVPPLFEFASAKQLPIAELWGITEMLIDGESLFRDYISRAMALRDQWQVDGEQVVLLAINSPESSVLTVVLLEMRGTL